jgi:hypothetical protein
MLRESQSFSDKKDRIVPKPIRQSSKKRHLLMEPRSETGEVVKQKSQMTSIPRLQPVRLNSIMAIRWRKLITQVVEEIPQI